MKELWRNNGLYDDYYLISWDCDYKPLAFYDINEWLAACILFPDYITEIPLTDNNKTVFDESCYFYVEEMLGMKTKLPKQPNSIHRHLSVSNIHWCGPSDEYNVYEPSIDFVMLKNKIHDRVPTDNSQLYRKYCDLNLSTVKQFLSGKDKVVNQLLGLILRDNKGYDPKVMKTELEKFIYNNYKKDEL